MWIIHSFNGKYNKVKHCINCYEEYPLDYVGKCERCLVTNKQKPPYSLAEYIEAKEQNLDLDDWNDYVKFWGLGEEVGYE